jgi:hypothetical protein
MKSGRETAGHSKSCLRHLCSKDYPIRQILTLGEPDCRRFSWDEGQGQADSELRGKSLANGCLCLLYAVSEKAQRRDHLDGLAFDG